MPEQSGNTSIVSHVINGLLTISGGLFIYQIIANSNWTFSPQWNMFDSILIGPLYIIGLLVMFANWNKFSFSQDTYIKTTYSDGSSKTEKSYDITDVIFGRLLLPLLGRFVIVPLLVSAAIYYPIMCLVWLVGSIFPYVLSFIIVVIIVALWLLCSSSDVSKNIIIYSVISFLLSAGFAFGAYYIHEGVTPVYNVATPSYQTPQSDGFDEGEFGNDEIDESEFE